MWKNTICLKMLLLALWLGIPLVGHAEEDKSASERKDTELREGVTLDSPDKTHSLSVKRDEVAGGEIILKDLRSGAERKVYEYPRSISGMWSPNSALFLLNDAGGSDYSTCVIFNLKNKKTMDLQEILAKNGPLRKYSYDICDHSYIYAKQWTSNTCILLDLHGHTCGEVILDGSAPMQYDFEMELTFDLDTRTFQILSKKENDYLTDGKTPDGDNK